MSGPLLIVNPTSGWDRTGRDFPAMRAAIERALGGVHIAYTARRGHAEELALRSAEEGHDPIVAVGGDGTLSEVVNGVMRAREGAGPTSPAGTGHAPPRPACRPRPAVGLIARGTGGDFRRSLGIDHRLEAYLEALGSGRERRVDVGRAHFRAPDGETIDHYFINVLSAGLGGLVDRYVASAPPLIGGKAAYYLASLRALVACHQQTVRCRGALAGAAFDWVLPAYVVAICNGRVFGAGMQIAPMAEIDDGRLEVVVVAGDSKHDLVRRFTGPIYKGTHLQEPGVEHFTCDRIELEIVDDQRAAGGARAARRASRRRGLYLLDVDGEPLGGLPLSVELLPGALTVRA